MVKKGYCDEIRFIPILVIIMELFKETVYEANINVND